MVVINLIRNELVGCPLSPILSTGLTFEKVQPSDRVATIGIEPVHERRIRGLRPLDHRGMLCESGSADQNSGNRAG